MKYPKLFLMFFFCLLACKSDDAGNITEVQEELDPFFTANIDGQLFTTNTNFVVDFSIIDEEESLRIRGTEEDSDFIEIQIYPFYGPGTYRTAVVGEDIVNALIYQDNGDDPGIYISGITTAGDGINEGEIIITERIGTIRGSFQFEGLYPDTGTVKTITNGDFLIDY